MQTHRSDRFGEGALSPLNPTTAHLGALCKGVAGLAAADHFWIGRNRGIPALLSD
jgi:hypothetical protein